MRIVSHDRRGRKASFQCERCEFHILELPKFGKSVAELASSLDVWLYFLRHAEK
jgi:hypothetical protein